MSATITTPAGTTRWEIATAVAGSVIGTDAFNQPRKLTSEYEKTESLPSESPVLSEGGVDLFTDAATRQAYKGGPNSGVFLQVTCGDKADLEVPGQKFTFGVVKASQARGDFPVLADRKRRVLRVHLHDVESGLAALQTAIAKALS